MTIKELKEWLENYPEDFEVYYLNWEGDPVPVGIVDDAVIADGITLYD